MARFGVSRSIGFFKVIVRDDERGFLYRNGRFVRLLEPGRFRVFDPNGNLNAIVVKVVRAEISTEQALLFKKTMPQMTENNFEIVQTEANEVAIVSFDGEPQHLLRPNSTRAFWKTVTRVDVERINTSVDLRVKKQHLDMLDLTNISVVTNEIVEAHEAGLLIVDGQFQELLNPGRHAFWAVARNVRVAKVDLRPQPLEVTAQEILTKDRVGIRVTLTAFTKVVDPETAVLGARDVSNTIYRYIQFAIREAVAKRTLDDILAARDKIDQEVRSFVTTRAEKLGIEVGEIGVKDVILPGDVRELLNKVVEAERVAKANLIRRQEETAATRSLLNTAKLMEDNPLLLRLKELESLERLVEKVGRIDLHAGEGGGLEALLNNLYTLGKDHKDVSSA